MILIVFLLVRFFFLEGEGGVVMGLLVFILEEKIGKNLNSFKMVINGIGGLIYNRIDYRKLMVFYKI